MWQHKVYYVCVTFSVVRYVGTIKFTILPFVKFQKVEDLIDAAAEV